MPFIQRVTRRDSWASPGSACRRASFARRFMCSTGTAATYQSAATRLRPLESATITPLMRPACISSSSTRTPSSKLTPRCSRCASHGEIHTSLVGPLSTRSASRPGVPKSKRSCSKV